MTKRSAKKFEKRRAHKQDRRKATGSNTPARRRNRPASFTRDELETIRGDFARCMAYNFHGIDRF